MTPTLRTERLELRPYAPERRVSWDSWSLHENGTYVGQVELMPSPLVDGYELVHALVPEAMGRGLDSELVEAVTEYALRSLGLAAVHATIDPHDERSLTLLRKHDYAEVRELIDGDTRSVLLSRTAEPGPLPITEHRGEWGPAVIEPSGLLKARPELPERVVLCFFREVIERVAADAPVVAELNWAHGKHPIRRIEVRGEPLAVLHPGVGAPLSAALLEEVIAYGGRRFVAVGGCGALVPELALGHVIVPTAALRDEGTSYHYLPPSRTVELDPLVVSVARKVLARTETPYVTGVTWTTDAPYRETPEIVERRRAAGAITVEMETAAFAAVAKRRGVSFGQLLYAGDSLAGDTWDSRHWWTAHDVRQTLFELAAEVALEL